MRTFVILICMIVGLATQVTAQNEGIKLYKQAMDSLAAKAYEGAIPLFKKLIATEFRVQESYEFLSSVYLFTENLDLGLQYAKEGHEKFPENVMLLKYVINFYSRKGDIKNTLEAVKKAIVLEPENDTLYAYLGNLYADIKELEMALVNYKKATELNTQNLMGYYGLGTIYVEKKIELTKKMNELAFDDKAYETYKKKIDELNIKAIKALEMAQSIDGANSSVLIALQQLYIATDQVEKYKKIKQKLKIVRGY